MVSARKLADEMVDAVHIDSNFFHGFMRGFVSLPVDFFYMSRDYIDTDSRAINFRDKERIIRIVKNGMASRESLEKVFSLFIDNFLEHVDFEKVKELSAKG